MCIHVHGVCKRGVCGYVVCRACIQVCGMRGSCVYTYLVCVGAQGTYTLVWGCEGIHGAYTCVCGALRSREALRVLRGHSEPFEQEITRRTHARLGLWSGSCVDSQNPGARSKAVA